MKWPRQAATPLLFERRTLCLLLRGPHQCPSNLTPGPGPKKRDIYSTGDRRVALIALLVIVISLALFVIHVLFVFLTPLSPGAECRIYTEGMPA